ncbi:MAG: protoporphyrinogen oxidase [Deltaproteobacteria bacterium]|nr:protoporphyrinogen oxidase [Deltaproteobacteria bacterium]
MTHNALTKNIVIIGGGITGLSAAHRLKELCDKNAVRLDVTVMDARDRLGGVIQTLKRDGFLIDTGPDNFVTAKPWALALARRLGLDSELITTNKAHRSALVVRDGRLMPIPEGFLLMAPTKLMPILTTPLFSIPGKLRMAMEYVLPTRKGINDESLASFVTRRFGREALDRVVQPLISGIYTARPETLSLRATMPRFLDLERQYGSVIKGMRAAGKKRKSAQTATGSGARYGMFVTFKGGLETLTNNLKDRVKDFRIAIGTPVTSIEKINGPASKWRIKTKSAPPVEADGVIIAGPAKNAAALLGDVDPVLAKALSAIRYASSAVVHLGYKRKDVSHPLDAFGCVVPITEQRRIIAASFSSVKYEGRAPADSVLLRAFMGGALNPELMALNDSGLIETACQDLHDLLGIRAEPRLAVVSRWPDSMAQYEVGHMERVADIRRRVHGHPGLELAGNGYEGVGIPDCVRAGEQAAESLFTVVQE